MNNPYKTAIRRNKPSAPLKALLAQDPMATDGLLQGRILDYGCGKGDDAEYLLNVGYNVWWWDPNPALKTFQLDHCTECHTFDTILCTYVLNVIDEHQQGVVLADILDRLAPGGKAYISVRRDLKEDKGCQRLVYLDLPIQYEKAGAFTTYRLDKS